MAMLVSHQQHNDTQEHTKDTLPLTHQAQEELYQLGCKGESCPPPRGMAEFTWGTLVYKLAERLISYFQTPFTCPEADRERREELTRYNENSPFLCLPLEIIYEVLYYLNAKDLAMMHLTCTHFAQFAKDEWLWHEMCERDFSPVKNSLAYYFGKTWKFIYRSKVVVFKGRGQIKDGDVGTLITKDGRYEGEWRGGELNGYGFLVSSVGNIIEGQWKSGMGHGYGRVSYANGDLYAGQWTDGGVTGKGVCYFMEGTVYKGEWKDNAVHGTGTCWFSDGNKYQGTWKQGKKDGPGVFHWKNGATWQGTWKNNKAEGKGKHYCPATGETTCAEWQNEFPCCASVNDAPQPQRDAS